MFTSSSCSTFFRRSLGLAVAAGVGIGTASAQTAAQVEAQPQGMTPHVQSAMQPLFPTGVQPFSLSAVSLPTLNEDASGFSSSASGSYDPATAAQTQLASLEKGLSMPGANAMQYGQRRRYGAPRYRGGNSNADGSEKYTGYAGGGFSSPASSNFNYAKTGWGAQVGVGRNFNRHFGVNLEFDYDHFGMTDTTLQNQETLYNTITSYYDPSYVEDGYAVSDLGGNSHIWSLSLNPVYNLRSGEGLGAYVTGGVGFYHKVANFTVPVEEEGFDYIYGPYAYTADETIDHYTSNAFGVNAGVGVTYKFSRFANERLYGEVKYVYTFNSNRPGVTLDNVSIANAGFTNDFPQNSLRTGYLPVKFGIRF